MDVTHIESSGDKDTYFIVNHEPSDLFAELIKEFPRRLGASSDPVVKKELEIDPVNDHRTEQEVIEGLTKALVWLKAQPLIKNEDGFEYPREAYAYTPSEDPSTWELRLWEGGIITKKQVDRASAYLSPGGFNGEKVQMDNLSLVKHRLREAYRELGVEERSKWILDTDHRELLLEFIPLTEAMVTDKGVAEVTVIQSGFNSNKGRYYPESTLQRDFHIFEGAKMFADHPTEKEDEERPERSIRDWVANLKNVTYKEGKVTGEAVIIEPWLKEKLANLKDKGLLSSMGISINAIGKASVATIENVKTNLIDSLTRARSVDFVTEAGAHGAVSLYETASTDIDLVTLEDVRERRPDIVELIESDALTQYRKEGKMNEELQTQIDTLTTEKDVVTKERDEALQCITEAEVAKAKAEAQASIVEAIDKAELPEPAKAKLKKVFAESTTSEGVDEAITQEKEYIAEVSGGGKVTGMGATQPDADADAKAFREVMKRQFPDWTDKQLDLAIRGR